MARTLDDAIKTLAEYSVHEALFGSQRTVTAATLLEDGRTRKRIWKELQQSGYLSDDLPDRPGEARILPRALDHYLEPGAEVDLTPLYAFDAYHDHKAKGNAFVAWSGLSLAQQATIIGRLRDDPSRYTLLAYDRYKDGAETHTALLGEMSRAWEAAGGWSSAVLAVTDARVQAKRDEAAREHYKRECLARGLNWYLHKTGAFEKEEELPLSDRQPLPGSFGVSRNPQDWPAGVPAAIQVTKERILALRQRLALLEKLEAYVERIGGWPVFLADYDSSIDAYAREAEAKGKLAQGVR